MSVDQIVEGIGHKVAGASSARKLLNVLLCFSADRPLWSVVELSEHLDVSMSTMYRYIALLREVGLIESAGDNSYRVSKRVIALARASEAGRSRLEDVALPVMTRLRDTFNETVLIARRNRDYAYCIERVESLQPVRLQFDRGQPMSLHRGAMARVLLATAPPAERERYLASINGGSSEKSAPLLTSAKLDEVASLGYAISTEEVDEGIWGTAAAIKSNQHTIAALGIAAPVYRLDTAAREAIVAAVRRGAEEISHALADSVPTSASPLADPTCYL
jgi:DNA-binding IclR family transcriptional regulator